MFIHFNSSFILKFTHVFISIYFSNDNHILDIMLDIGDRAANITVTALMYLIMKL